MKRKKKERKKEVKTDEWSNLAEVVTYFPHLPEVGVLAGLPKEIYYTFRYHSLRLTKSFNNILIP